MKKDVEQVLDILSFSKAIEKLYDKLADLEVKGLKDSEEYSSLYDLVGTAREIEMNKYKKIGNFFTDDMVDLKKLITDLNRTTEEDILNVINTNPSSNKLKRLYANIRDISLIRNDEPPMDAPSEDEMKSDGKDVVFEMFGMRFRVPGDQAAKLGLNTNQQQSKEQIEEEREQRRLSCDIIYYKYCVINSLFLNYLNEYIDNCTNKNIKNRLIRYKYKLIYITPSLENAFIKGTNNAYYYQEMMRIKNDMYPDDVNVLYTMEIAGMVNDAVYELSQANYDAKNAKIDEKVISILKVLYTKALVSSVFDQEMRDYLQMTNTAGMITCESKDDERNVEEAFNIKKSPVLNRKKVD